MQEEEEAEDGERFERYTPQFPLPNDISNMSRKDTVCKFCGVSYLIHNEIKALEAKCKKLESDLAFFAGIDSREAALEKTLENERAKISDLQSTISINQHKLNELTRKVQLVQDQFEQSDRAYRETKTALSECRSSLRSTQQKIQPIRNEYQSLRSFYEKQMSDMKSSIVDCQRDMDREIRKVFDQYNKQMQQTIDKKNRSIRDLEEKYEQIQNVSRQTEETTQKNIDQSRQQLASLRNDLTLSEKQRNALEIELNQTKENYRQVQEQFEQSQTRNNRLSQDHESLLTTLKQLEMNETNNKRKFDETNRSRQAVLDRTRDEYEKLLHKYTDLDELYRELTEKREQETIETQRIRDELERLHNDNIELSKQRETLLITHDVQLKKLHDQYSKQLQDAEQWPDRLQTELNRERENHRIQMNELERRLKENFLTELNIEKEKYNGLLRKYGQDNDHSTEQLRHELLSTEKVTMEQRQYYTKQIDHLERDKTELKTELDNLRSVLKDLHEQMTQKNNTVDRTTTLQLKEDLLAKETSLFQAQNRISELEKELQQAQEEMSTLQETVHHECDEREQLKDALIEARQQLLTLKKAGVLNGNVSRSLHSPPMAFEDIERRANAAQVQTQIHSQQRPKIASIAHSEPPTRDSSLPGDLADLTARPMSSTQNPNYRLRALPPIQSQNQQSRNRSLPTTLNKAEQLLANQRRIARFIKHIK